jgi:putative endonuclease
MEKYKNFVGKLGEDRARKYLIQNGYKILESNYFCRFGEIGIIAMDKNCLVFIEVKTRTNGKYGNPENAVNYWKKKHMELTARNYIDHKRMGNFIARFDVVEVFMKNADNNFIVEKFNLIKNVL